MWEQHEEHRHRLKLARSHVGPGAKEKNHGKDML